MEIILSPICASFTGSLSKHYEINLILFPVRGQEYDQEHGNG